MIALLRLSRRLSSCVELMLGDDYELELVKKCRINGRRYRKYVVSVNDGD